MTERIFEGFIDSIEGNVIYAAGVNKGEPVWLDLPVSKWPLGKPKTIGTIFYIEVNGAYTDIVVPDDKEIKLMNPWERFMLWLKNLAKPDLKEKV